jgi:hypothetical protein
MSINIGDRVYHTGVRGNGIVKDIDPEKQKDKYLVEFLWGKYCDTIKHGEFLGFKHPERKWQYCRESSLIVLENEFSQWHNRISSLGKRSLDRLIRNVCEIKPRRKRDGSDIVISYGQWKHKVPHNVLVLNRNLISNKYEQCKLLGGLAPESHLTRPGEPIPSEWIIKPFYSMGGRGIGPANRELRNGEYFQRMFNKKWEFRVHCFLWADNPVPLIQQKFIENPDQLCWNKKQGGDFKYVYQEQIDNLPDGHLLDKIDSELPSGMAPVVDILTNMSIKALKLLKYDFGGVDVGVDADGNVKIFEVNSRMGVKEQSLFTYKRMFNQLRTLNINEYLERRWW